MKKKIFMKYTIALISLAILSGTTLVLACAVWFDEDNMSYSFFAPETSRADAYTPFYRNFHLIYQNEGYNPVNNFDKKNTEEWVDFFKNKANTAAIQTLLYDCRIGAIDSLIRFVSNKNYPCDERLKKNSVLKLKKDMVIPFLQYLYYAKRCEPYATYVYDGWGEVDTALDIKQHPDVSSKLIETGKKLMSESRSDFIKQRYAFQVTRLYFLSNKPEDCLNFYQQVLPLFSDKYSIKYRSMGYAAGALYKMKRYSEANYLYSLIYDQCEQLKISAYSSFHPLEEEDWQACLARAKNTREKNVIWQLMGIYADPFRAMQEIYKTEPASDLLDLLLTRSVNIEEEKFLPLRDSYEGEADTIYSFKTTKLNKELVGFIRSVADKGNTHKTYIWNLASSYLSIIQGEYKTADNYIAKVKKEIKDDSLVLEQVRMFEIISNVEQEKRFDTAFERKIAEELTWLHQQPHQEGLRHESMYHWLTRRLAEKYNSIGEIVKAQCLNVNSNNYFYQDEQKIRKMIAYMDKPDKTIFDTWILKEYAYTKADVFDLQGSELLYQYKFKEAIAKFEECSGAGDATLMADPFVIHINDCHDCDFNALEIKKYSKLTFAKKMLALENKLNANPKNAAVAFDLANGYYNMTYFGNCRILYQTHIKYYPDDIDWGFEQQGRSSWLGSYYMSSSASTMNCERAEMYYKMAMQLSNDSEFKAKCCFMAAKTEQNTSYISETDTLSHHYFKLLRDTYSKTNYYKEIIKECGYFEAYVKINK
jgi:hypothetical protein